MDQLEQRCAALPVQTGRLNGDMACETAQFMMDDYDDDPLDRVSEQDLRRIFCGLVE